MSYQSIDILQRSLASTIFSDKKDAKKAAGRALGTIVEIITYYLLRQWGFINNIAIETKLPEFGNTDITHNVEFTLHKVIRTESSELLAPISINRLKRIFNYSPQTKKPGNLIDRFHIIKNATIIGQESGTIGICNIFKNKILFSVITDKPLAMFECKRVGVEEGQKKGPQTIEKAKQGAYVALKSSSLQKVRDEDGTIYGVFFKNGELNIEIYEDALNTCLKEEPIDNFILSVGIISNHGNWFTSEDMNKELKVLAQSYDRLLFLTDTGLSSFIDLTILNPTTEYQPIRNAFITSYQEGKKTNFFTKSKISLEAHIAMDQFFKKNISLIESWFNIISPTGMTITDIKNQLHHLFNNR